jgi:hypothetical protein
MKSLGSYFAAKGKARFKFVHISLLGTVHMVLGQSESTTN